MGEVHDLKRFYEAKLEEIGIKVPPDSALDLVVKLEAEHLRQFLVRWGIKMERHQMSLRPATAADAARLKELEETDERIWMFDPRMTGEMVVKRT